MKTLIAVSLLSLAACSTPPPAGPCVGHNYLSQSDYSAVQQALSTCFGDGNCLVGHPAAEVDAANISNAVGALTFTMTDNGNGTRTMIGQGSSGIVMEIDDLPSTVQLADVMLDLFYVNPKLPNGCAWQ